MALSEIAVGQRSVRAYASLQRFVRVSYVVVLLVLSQMFPENLQVSSGESSSWHLFGSGVPVPVFFDVLAVLIEGGGSMHWISPRASAASTCWPHPWNQLPAGSHDGISRQ